MEKVLPAHKGHGEQGPWEYKSTVPAEDCKVSARVQRCLRRIISMVKKTGAHLLPGRMDHRARLTFPWKWPAKLSRGAGTSARGQDRRSPLVSPQQQLGTHPQTEVGAMGSRWELGNPAVFQDREQFWEGRPTVSRQCTHHRRPRYSIIWQGAWHDPWSGPLKHSPWEVLLARPLLEDAPLSPSGDRPANLAVTVGPETDLWQICGLQAHPSVLPIH